MARRFKDRSPSPGLSAGQLAQKLAEATAFGITPQPTLNLKVRCGVQTASGTKLTTQLHPVVDLTLEDGIIVIWREVS